MIIKLGGANFAAIRPFAACPLSLTVNCNLLLALWSKYKDTDPIA